MAIKKTKRKAFNFLRSYFDVLNELQNDQDRLSFLMSIINKQFLDEDPKELNFLVNLCYESQRHSIETSVNGWKTATNNTLLGDPLTPLAPPLQGDPQAPKQEEEVKEKVKGEVKGEQTQKAFSSESDFLEFFNQGRKVLLGTEGKTRVMSSTDSNNFKKLNRVYTRLEFKHAIKMMSKEPWVKTASKFTISHLLAPANFDKYLNKTETLPMAQGLIEGN